MSKSIEIVGNSCQMAAISWVVYFGLDAIGWQATSEAFGFNALIFSALSLLGLGVLPIMWIWKHVRITII